MHVNEFDEATNLLATVIFPLSKDCQNEKWKSGAPAWKSCKIDKLLIWTDQIVGGVFFNGIIFQVEIRVCCLQATENIWIFSKNLWVLFS